MIHRIPNHLSCSSATSLSRRHLLQFTAGALAAGPLGASLTRSAFSQDDRAPLNRYPRMVHEYMVEQVRESRRRNLEMLDRLQTKEDAEKYVQSVRERIRQSFGPEPERTPLNPKVTGVVERDGYRIEKVIFESRPNFPVTANLYLPTDREGPFPGVVGSCGHSSNGKAAGAYQAFSQGLAKLGYACLIFDPIGQGERLQYVKEDLSPRIGTGTREHLHAGNQQFLVGEYFCMWRAWDGIRALDYLLTREEVDKNHLGITGNSGGGTMTTWLCGVERRWTMGAPSCFVTTFLHNLENELPADTEQCPPRALALNLDHSDFLAAMAPRPVIILAKERDYFDVRGSHEAYERLRKLYRLLGAEENVGLFYGPTGHGFSEENREAMYSWFNFAVGDANRVGSEGKAGDFDGYLETDADLVFQPEPELTMEEDETLWCTPNGQVAEFDTTRTVFSFTKEKSQTLAQERKGLRGDALRRAVRNVLNLPELPEEPPHYRIWRYLGSRGYPSRSAVAYGVETEPGIQIASYRLTEERWHSRPPQAGERAILYVAHLSSDAELREEPLIREVMEAEPEVPVFTCDVRGIGESMPGTGNPSSFHSAYGNDYFYAVHSIMLDRPYLGQKTFDLLRVLQWLESIGHTDVHLVCRGWGCLSGAFASLFAGNVKQVTFKHALESYAALAETEHYDWPLSTLLPHVLEEFDLPDCYRELEGKKLRQIEPWGAEPAGAGQS
jgi:dienelactone hydrolase